MKSISKSVEVGTSKVNATITQEMVDDLKNFKYFDAEAALEKLLKEEILRERMIQRNKRIDSILETGGQNGSKNY